MRLRRRDEIWDDLKVILVVCAGISGFMGLSILLAITIRWWAIPTLYGIVLVLFAVALVVEI